MALDRDNRDTAYVTGRMIAIVEHYACHRFGPLTLSEMYNHPAHGVEVFRRYIDKDDDYYKELQDLELPVTAKDAVVKSQMWVGYYHQKAAYSQSDDTIRARIRARIAERGIKLAWLAERAGIHRSALSAYLGGKRGIPYDVLEKLFRILDL